MATDAETLSPSPMGTAQPALLDEVPEKDAAAPSLAAFDDRPVTPESAPNRGARPAADRQESSHEYSATGLDSSPRTPTRGWHVKSPSKSRNTAARPSPDSVGHDHSTEIQNGTGTAEGNGSAEPKAEVGSAPTYAEVAKPPVADGEYGTQAINGEPDDAMGKRGPKSENDGQLAPRDAKDNGNDRWDRDEDQAHRTGGIRFAPWNVPLRRRLQTLAVLWHSTTIGLCLGLFWFLCALPLMWPLLFWYLVHVVFSKDGFDGSTRRRSERLRRLPVWKWFAEYFPAKLHKTHDLPPTRKYILGYHPHGIISHGAWVAFGTEGLGFSELFPGITNSLVTLDSNFRTPLYRDYILAMGLHSVSKESITKILTTGGRNGEGMGRAVTVVVGGARESLEAQPGTMKLILKSRKGFVKMALRTGADLVPVLGFGENDLYNQLTAEGHPRLHRLQMWILKVAKFTLPFLHGRGIFNYDVGLMPYRRPLNIVVGRPIPVVQAESDAVDTAEVDRLHALYIDGLHELWNTYKDQFAPDRKEEMTLIA